MKRAIFSRWPYLWAGLVLSAILFAFWVLNQGYMTPRDGVEASFLENPLPAFGLMIFGAFVAASVAGEFAIKLPLTIEPIVFAFIGGGLAGAGSIVAGMSVNSVVLFNLAGVFTLPAFMITQGWLYLVFMIAGGAFGSRLLVLTTLKLGRARREIFVPEMLNGRQARLAYAVAAGLMTAAIIAAFVILAPADSKPWAALSMLLMALLGFAAERGTVCMSSMLKELFVARSAVVWRTVLFTVMCLALLYRLGLEFGLYAAVEVDSIVASPLLLAVGSFIMGVGFVFADGCFIGTLWKVGQGNVVNMAGLVGLLFGIGATQVAGRFLALPTSSGSVPNELISIMDPWLLLAVLWILGSSALLKFRRKAYRY